MAKYLTEFNTYAEYSAATLSYPNVSLIKSTGKVYYKNIYAGSTLGDILMYDVANQKLVSTISGNWNTTMFPIASYEPIAINVYPADQASDGKSRWLSLKNVGSYKWGPNSSVAGEYTSTDENALNGRANTDKVLEIADYATNFLAFNAVNNFVTSGTTAGDWYLPSKGEMTKLISDIGTIKNQINNIRSISTSKADLLNTWYFSSTEGSTTQTWGTSSNVDSFLALSRGSAGIRAMLAL